MKTIGLWQALGGVALLCSAATANAVTLDATGAGWINSSGVSNNSGFGGTVTNHFAGIEVLDHRDFLTFNLPSGPITSATLSIWNAGQNMTADVSALFQLFGASTYSYAGLASGTAFASTSLFAADTGIGHYVDLTLNAAGLAYLNAHAGSSVSFGGAVTTAIAPGSSCDDCVSIFGFTTGSPSPTLTIDQAAATPAPEPASWAMFIGGFGLIGAAMRRRTLAVRFG